PPRSTPCIFRRQRQMCIRDRVNAARAIHADNEMGSIAVGQFANIAIFDDSFKMHGTVSGGELKFS
ncbi:MAG: hypothetical protein RM811_016130, partial [Endozoicomonas sp.]